MGTTTQEKKAFGSENALEKEDYYQSEEICEQWQKQREKIYDVEITLTIPPEDTPILILSLRSADSHELFQLFIPGCFAAWSSAA